MHKRLYGSIAAGVYGLVAASAVVYKHQQQKHQKPVVKKDHDLELHDIKPDRDFDVAKFHEIQRSHQREHKNINHITHRHQPINALLNKRYKRM